MDPSIESKDPKLLSDELQSKLAELQRILNSEQHDMRIGAGLRGPLAQAWLWCRSRSEENVKRWVDTLNNAGAQRIAALLRPEFAGLGPPCTDNLPGQSWHQWGEAVDVYFSFGGVTFWEGTIAKRCARVAGQLGLVHSDSLLPRRRHWHLQLRKEVVPLLCRGFVDSWSQVEEEMVRRFDI